MKINKSSAGISVRIGGLRLSVDWDKRKRNALHEQGVWTTANHREIPVTEMDDSHLVNTLKYLARQVRRATEKRMKPAGFISVWSYPEPQGEMAQDAYYQAAEYEDHVYYTPEEVAWSYLVRHPIIPHLIKEIQYRQLFEVTVLGVQVCYAKLDDLKNPWGTPGYQ